MTTTQKEAVAAEKKVPIAEKWLKEAQDNLDKINQAVVDTKEEKTKAEKNLVKHKKRVAILNNLD